MARPITRRAALSLVGGATAALASGAAFAAPAGGIYPWPLGVQLWSVAAELDRDLAATLAALASLGYREVETAGLHGHSPAEFLRAAGLRLVGVHLSMADLLADPAGGIGVARDLGAQWLVCSSPRPDRPLQPGVEWITAMQRAMTPDAWKTNAAALNRLGAAARGAGLGFAYHNHPFDMARFGGARAYDLLLGGTDPALVKLELDIAWAMAGGADPVALLRRHPDRVRLIHVKGLATRPRPGRMARSFATTVPGDRDVIDWRQVIAAARRAGVEHAFVEQEPPYRQPVLQSLALARDYLKGL